MLAEAQMRAQLDTPGLLFPLRQAVEQQLVNSDLYLDEVGTLLLQYQLPDGNKPLQALRVQISAWKEFLRRDILPRAREDFRLPEELYALRLREAGVDISPGELSARALTGFVEIRNQMLALAPLVADHLQLEARDYLGVIRELRSKQLADGATLPLYQERLTAVTDIIRREKLVSLPAQEVLIRRATPAESASLPTPFLQPPPLINNQGEQGSSCCRWPAPRWTAAPRNSRTSTSMPPPGPSSLTKRAPAMACNFPAWWTTECRWPAPCLP